MFALENARENDPQDEYIMFAHLVLAYHCLKVQILLPMRTVNCFFSKTLKLFYSDSFSCDSPTA